MQKMLMKLTAEGKKDEKATICNYLQK